MKAVLSLLLACLVVSAVGAQPIDTSKLDLTKAVTSVAGPNRIYVRNVYYEGRQLSLLMEYDGKNGAVVYGPYYAEDKVIPDSANLDFVRFRVQNPTTLAISNVIARPGLAYSGTAEWEGGAELVLQKLWESVPPETYQGRIARLQAENANLKADSQRLAADVARLEEQVSAPRVSAPQAAPPAAAPSAVVGAEKPLPANVVYSGFARGRALYGTWQMQGSRVRQTDSARRYAKFVLPVAQSAPETVYQFTARATGSGWTGYGLHFFASGDQTSSGYGFGRSYLVWLTRDPGYYGSDATYVQLYRSYDDVRMIQVASMTFPRALDSPLQVRVLYDRPGSSISVYVEGSKVFDYAVENPIASGSEIALRALGGQVEFSGLSVNER